MVRKLVEPEVVATSPYRIKSPVPVYCGVDSVRTSSKFEVCGSKLPGEPGTNFELQTLNYQKGNHPRRGSSQHGCFGESETPSTTPKVIRFWILDFGFWIGAPGRT
jgi:hypothetical protein